VHSWTLSFCFLFLFFLCNLQFVYVYVGVSARFLFIQLGLHITHNKCGINQSIWFCRPYLKQIRKDRSAGIRSILVVRAMEDVSHPCFPPIDRLIYSDFMSIIPKGYVDTKDIVTNKSNRNYNTYTKEILRPSRCVFLRCKHPISPNARIRIWDHPDANGWKGQRQWSVRRLLGKSKWEKPLADWMIDTALGFVGPKPTTWRPKEWREIMDRGGWAIYLRSNCLRFGGLSAFLVSLLFR
jgi:hypothetical protein